jgi:hypothetical protein
MAPNQSARTIGWNRGTTQTRAISKMKLLTKGSKPDRGGSDEWARAKGIARRFHSAARASSDLN